MGNSRVLFVGALSIMLGMATEDFKRSDARYQAIPVVNADRGKAEMIAGSGLRNAVIQMRAANFQSVSNRSYLGGAYSYTITMLAPQDGMDCARITCSGSYNGQSYVAVGMAQEAGTNSWKLTKSYVSRSLTGQES